MVNNAQCHCCRTYSIGMTDFRTRPSTKRNPYTDLDHGHLGSTPYQFVTNYGYDRDYPETRVVEGREHRIAKDERGEEVVYSFEWILLYKSCYELLYS